MNEEPKTPEPEIKPKDTQPEPEYSVDLNNLASVNHNWVKRGIKISCENAGHPHHSHFLINPR